MTHSTHANDATSTAQTVGIGRKNETEKSDKPNSTETQAHGPTKSAEAKAPSIPSIPKAPPAPPTAARDAATRKSTEIARKHAARLSERVASERRYAKGILRHPEVPVQPALITRNDLSLGEARYEHEKRLKELDRKDAERRAARENAKREAAERVEELKRLGVSEAVALAATSPEGPEASLFPVSSSSSSLPALPSAASSLPLLTPAASPAAPVSRPTTVEPDPGVDTFIREMEEAFPALRAARLEANRLSADYSKMSIVDKRRDKGKALLAEVKKAQQALSRLMKVADLFREIRPMLDAQLLAGDATVAKGMARVGLRVLCRDDGIEIRFDGSTPCTNGEVIQLGRIDFSNPLGVIYAWGSGIHERNHVLYSDFRAVRDLTGFMLFLTNVFEDIRVDALGDRDLAGYRTWRNALYKVLSMDPTAGFLRAEGLNTPALVAGGWLWALLTETVLEFKLPTRLREKTARRADELFGTDFRKSTESYVLGKFPLEDTYAARQLAYDVLESFESETSNQAVSLRSQGLIDDSSVEAIDLMIENFNALGKPKDSDEEGASDAPDDLDDDSNSDQGRKAGRGPGVRGGLGGRAGKGGKSGRGSYRASRSLKDDFDDADSDDQPALFAPDGSVSGAAAPEGAESPEAKLERLRALRTVARESERSGDFSDPIASALRNLVGEVIHTIPDAEYVSEAEQLAMGLESGRLFIEAYRARGYVPESVAYSAWGKHAGHDTNALEARIAFQVTEELRTKTFGFGAALLDDIRRPVTLPVRKGTTGRKLLEDAPIRLRTGNPRVFKVRGKAPGLSVALQIAVDLSGSVSAETGAILKCAAYRLEEVFKSTRGLAARTAVFPSRTRLGVIPVSDWNTPAEDTYVRIAPIPGRGPTPVQEAAFWGLEGLSGRREERRILFVFSDGKFPKQQLEGYADELRMSGIELGLLLVGRPEDVEHREEIMSGDHIYGFPTVFVDRVESIPKGVRVLLRRTLDGTRGRGF